MPLNAADAIWVATAHLHQENPDAADFPPGEIIQRTLQERRTDAQEVTIQTHVFRHCVANLEPAPAKLRMLQATAMNRRRLHRPGDPCHPQRQGAHGQPGRRIVPLDLPPELRPLLKWYAEEYAATAGRDRPIDPILALRGAGKALWGSEHPDEYVRQLREGWA